MINQGNRIQVSNPAVIGNLENDINTHFLSHSYGEPVIIDLYEITFIEITSMVFLAQLIQKRHSDHRRLVTKIILPRHQNVNIILHTWRFFEIVEELTNEDIETFIEGDFFKTIPFEIDGTMFYKRIDQDYFQKYYDDKGIQQLVEKGFFSLIRLPFKTNDEKKLALRDQRIKWRTDKLIADVLERNLLNKSELGNLLSNTIIYECLTNAANHPESADLVMGSFFDSKKNRLSENSHANKVADFHFTIIVWENGKSIINTLKDSIHSGENIRSTMSFTLAEKSGLTSWTKLNRSYESNAKTDNYLYNYVPDKSSLDDEIFLSSFFPGISRNPDLANTYGDEYFIEKEKIENISVAPSISNQFQYRGLGLTFLLNAVVTQLEGTLSVRTDDYFINFKKADSKTQKEYERTGTEPVGSIFKAKITKAAIQGNSFLGNMITIRIPLQIQS